jgi:uncharacterized peroxidase-related enzyme
MALIDLITPEKAEGDIKTAFDQVSQSIGMVPDGLQMLANSPIQFQIKMMEIGYFMQHPRFSPQLMAFIRLLVAQRTDCKFCVDFNAAMLLQSGVESQALEATQKDAKQAPLSDDEKALLLFGLQVTESPQSVCQEDIDQLKGHGYNTQEILEISALATASMAFDKLATAFKL